MKKLVIKLVIDDGALPLEKQQPREVRNVIVRSLIDGSRFFFVPKMKVGPNGVGLVQSKKFDITEGLQPYLLTKYRVKREGK